ncbi:ferritin [Echinococcus multilocularis]|uniref:Ferritin n=1 Tax=Echinococcus multilocularis TaxID=6211 RepID=A0A068Y3H6_ECHMU|nr:ferritin [Echinococcus multilocularis]
MSLVRQNFHEECEAGINRQINMELYASYLYLAMSQHFDRDDVALPGFREFFAKASEEEREHAIKLMRYQCGRGGRIVYQDIAKPQTTEWASGLEAMEMALKIEHEVNESILALRGVASKNNDSHFCEFLEDEFLGEQVSDIKKLAGYVTNLKRCGPGLGEYIFDKETLQGGEK